MLRKTDRKLGAGADLVSYSTFILWCYILHLSSIWNYFKSLVFDYFIKTTPVKILKQYDNYFTMVVIRLLLWFPKQWIQQFRVLLDRKFSELELISVLWNLLRQDKYQRCETLQSPIRGGATGNHKKSTKIIRIMRKLFSKWRLRLLPVYQIQQLILRTILGTFSAR